MDANGTRKVVGRGGVNLMHYKLSDFGWTNAEAASELLIFLSSFLFLFWRERRQGVKVTGCDGRQFMLLCLNCHLMCMQSGMLSKKKKRDTSFRRSSGTRCEDKRVWSDQANAVVDLTNLELYNQVWVWCVSVCLSVCGLWLHSCWTPYLSVEFSHRDHLPPTQLDHVVLDTSPPHTLVQIPASTHTNLNADSN